jgi:hypothetical protein
VPAVAVEPETAIGTTIGLVPPAALSNTPAASHDVVLVHDTERSSSGTPPSGASVTLEIGPHSPSFSTAIAGADSADKPSANPTATQFSALAQEIDSKATITSPGLLYGTGGPHTPEPLAAAALDAAASVTTAARTTPAVHRRID